jgi:hypothetical protein
MDADVERRVALELPTHRLMHIDVGERLKKVWRPSAYCGGSYGGWRDRSGGRHGRIVHRALVVGEWWNWNACALCPVPYLCQYLRPAWANPGMSHGRCMGHGRDGQTIYGPTRGGRWGKGKPVEKPVGKPVCVQCMSPKGYTKASQ